VGVTAAPRRVRRAAGERGGGVVDELGPSMAAPALAPSPGLAERPGSLRRRSWSVVPADWREVPASRRARLRSRNGTSAVVTATQSPSSQTSELLPGSRPSGAGAPDGASAQGPARRPATRPSERSTALPIAASLDGNPSRSEGRQPNERSEAGGTPHLGPHPAAVPAEPPAGAQRADHPAPTPGVAATQPLAAWHLRRRAPGRRRGSHRKPL
jgi:hypothetical protein